MPVRHAAVKDGDGHEQHQRIHGQQIAREQRAAQHAEEQGIDQKQEKDAQAGWPVKRCAVVALGVGAGIEQQRGEGHQHRHKQVHVRGEVQDAMAEGGQDAQGRERGLGVVAQKFRIAEEKAGFGVVIGVPSRQRQNAAAEPGGFAPEAGSAPERRAGSPPLY